MSSSKGALASNRDGRGRLFVHTVEAAARMDNLLRGLRTYMRVSETCQPPLEETDAGEVLNKALLNLEAAIEESGASITVAALPRVRMHEFQLEHLFQNLIGNAIRYRNERAAHKDSRHLGRTRLAVLRAGQWDRHRASVQRANLRRL